MDNDQLFFNATHLSSQTAHHLLSGSFRSASLFLLVFSPINRVINHVQTATAFGPHQYLGVNQKKDRVYATTWSLPPALSSWEVERRTHGNHWQINHLNNVPITATSSYVTIPPPYKYSYSMGGPTGEVHILNPENGKLGQKIQEVLFVDADELATADKTRVALRYGSHGIEFSPPSGHAFVPVLGTNTIEMYTYDHANGFLQHIFSSPSPRGADAHDGPRHVKVHPNGKILYCVTEHTNFVDIYRITPTSLVHIASRSILPPHLSAVSPKFRGDTLMLTPSTTELPTPLTLFTTTRGGAMTDRGWIGVFRLEEDGNFASPTSSNPVVDYYETPTSGGKAHALDLLSKTESHLQLAPIKEAVWILLTDDSDLAASNGGCVRVLEWDGWGGGGGIQEVAHWPRDGDDGFGDSPENGVERMRGASHAIWLD